MGCFVCDHPKIDAINAALKMGVAPDIVARLHRIDIREMKRHLDRFPYDDPRVMALLERVQGYYEESCHRTGKKPSRFIVTEEEYRLLHGHMPHDDPIWLFGMRVVKPLRLDWVHIPEHDLAWQAMIDRISTDLVASLGVHPELLGLGPSEQRPARHDLPVVDSDESSDAAWEAGVYAMLADARARRLAKGE